MGFQSFKWDKAKKEDVIESEIEGGVNGWPPNPTSKIEGGWGVLGGVALRERYLKQRGNGGWPHTIVEERGSSEWPASF